MFYEIFINTNHMDEVMEMAHTIEEQFKEDPNKFKNI